MCVNLSGDAEKERQKKWTREQKETVERKEREREDAEKKERKKKSASVSLFVPIKSCGQSFLIRSSGRHFSTLFRSDL